jgi:flagellar biosynthesis protein FlhF
MRIKRTFAPTMREALILVKQEQGADAVILGNKKVAGGVEIISAIDFDENAINAAPLNVSTLHPATHGSAANSRTAAHPVDARIDDELESDSWVGPLVTDPLHGRREPTLGPVAGIAKKKPVAPAKPPAWLEQAFERAEKMPMAASQQPVPPVEVQPSLASQLDIPQPKNTLATEPARSLPHKIQSNTADAMQQPKPKQPNKRESQLSRATQTTQKAAKKPAAPTTGPMIDEVRTELKGLRDLMQSQLSVLQWDQFAKRHPVRTVLLNLMSELGLGADVCEIVISHLDELNHDPHKVWQQALGILAKCLPVNRTDILADGGRIALVGSTGVGKTTTIAKLAARFAHIHGKRSVAMISTDHFRIGAQEQLQHFARLLELPLLTANTSEELSDRLDMLADKKLVLIDTAGMSQHDLRLSERFHRLQNSAPQIKPYLVLSANTQLAAINQTIKCFSKVQLAGAIITKLDEAASLGGVITASVRHQLPLSYCGTGQRVPEDLESAKVHRLISKAVALMQSYSESEGQETLAIRYNNIVNQSVAKDAKKSQTKAGL